MNMFKCALQTNMKQQINITSWESQLAGGEPVGYLQSVQELSSGPPKRNPSSGRKEDLNPGPPACKSSALTTKPRSPPTKRTDASFKGTKEWNTVPQAWNTSHTRIEASKETPIATVLEQKFAQTFSCFGTGPRWIFSFSVD